MLESSGPAPIRHLVAVWNPSYADAIGETVELLLAAARRHRNVAADEEDVYVWWGKVKSSNRQQPLPHLADLLAIDHDLGGDDAVEREVHLYLTDYRSLYVAHVAEITTDDVATTDPEHVPAFYGTAGLRCDCWFRLWDIRRVVLDDTPAVVEELKKLRNTRYNDRPVSIYGGMVDLPLIVTRDDGARYFDLGVRDRLIDGRFWVEFDAERSGVGHMEQELRENLFGDDVWSALDPAARGFIATAEAVFRAHRHDSAFDFSAVILDFSKALEVQVNLLVRAALDGESIADRLANIDGRTVDLANGAMWSLGQLARAIADEEFLNRALKRTLVNGDWFAASLPPILAELAAERNPAAHTTRVSREQAVARRNRLVGVGCEGVFAKLGKVSVKP